ncbi:endonuclease/exonuclease/phosphatase family protein [Oceaniglobus trochenteri]|uniref:endonuclease/exonuclease/phosphatase family protein n=1 Tax=Oceaniglobus trochenteri TaxID=2763260 RepID=UPI001CFFD0A5|nr:endonuclease/exonuclease/phosphatase family protein [Oceaniglobus trochenteri]
MTLRIASWNIRKAVGLDWRRNPTRVLHVLRAMAPDIVLLQEADRRLPPRHPALPLDAVRAAGWNTVDADPRTVSIGHHGNAVLLHPDFATTRIEPLDLPGLEPRGAVLTRIEGRGMALTLGALHLGLKRRDRLRQMAHVIAAAAPLGGPVVLGGDLNEWRPGPEVFDLPPGWTLLAPGKSFHADAPMLPLDRFVLGRGITLHGHGVLPRQQCARASDHLPIWAELSFGDTA